jgi:mono/diheme cytochrome c family protein
MRIALHLLALSVLSTQSAVAGDAETGRRLAFLRCAPCHIVAPNERREVAESLPFETIAWKFEHKPELLVLAILAPHPRMNLTISPREAEDLAAYIDTLAR